PAPASGIRIAVTVTSALLDAWGPWAFVGQAPSRKLAATSEDAEGRSKNPGFWFDPKAFSEGKRGTEEQGGEQKQGLCSPPERLDCDRSAIHSRRFPKLTLSLSLRLS